MVSAEVLTSRAMDNVLWAPDFPNLWLGLDGFTAQVSYNGNEWIIWSNGRRWTYTDGREAAAALAEMYIAEQGGE
jgi:hypothetical protein